jgi:hypothetical protein
MMRTDSPGAWDAHCKATRDSGLRTIMAVGLGSREKPLECRLRAVAQQKIENIRFHVRDVFHHLKMHVDRMAVDGDVSDVSRKRDAVEGRV